MSHQQQSAQPVIVTRLLLAFNLLPNDNLHHLGIFDFQFPHPDAPPISHQGRHRNCTTTIRHYLRRYVSNNIARSYLSCVHWPRRGSKAPPASRLQRWRPLRTPGERTRKMCGTVGASKMKAMMPIAVPKIGHRTGMASPAIVCQTATLRHARSHAGVPFFSRSILRTV